MIYPDNHFDSNGEPTGVQMVEAAQRIVIPLPGYGTMTHAEAQLLQRGIIESHDGDTVELQPKPMARADAQTKTERHTSRFHTARARVHTVLMLLLLVACIVGLGLLAYSAGGAR